LGGCMIGDKLDVGYFPAEDPNTAYFSFIFLPNLDQNGDNRLLLRVVDDQLAPSQSVVLEIRVLPINDYPWFTVANASLGANNNGTDVFDIISEVTDIRDYKFGHTVSIVYTVVVPDGGDASVVGGQFYLPPTSAAGVVPPCVVAPNGLSINCTDKIEKVNSWLKAGIPLEPYDGVTEMIVFLNVSDHGAIDKLNRSLDNNATLYLNRTVDGLTSVAVTPSNNVALIAAPIAGVLAGALIAGLIFAIRRKQAKAAVENYFDKFALGVEGMTHASPLYVEAKKGGESPIYKSTADAVGKA